MLDVRRASGDKGLGVFVSERSAGGVPRHALAHSEPAVAYVPLHPQLQCNTTLHSDEALRRCSACKLVTYSSAAAQKSAWLRRAHREECRALQALGRMPVPLIRLAAQCVWLRVNLDSLCSHPTQAETDSDDATLLCRMVQAGSPDAGILEHAAARQLLRCLILNAFVIADAELQPVGLGVFPGLASRLNHDEQANCVQLFNLATTPPAIHIFATRTVAPGGELTISYSPRREEALLLRRFDCLYRHGFDICPGVALPATAPAPQRVIFVDEACLLPAGDAVTRQREMAKTRVDAFDHAWAAVTLNTVYACAPSQAARRAIENELAPRWLRAFVAITRATDNGVPDDFQSVVEPLLEGLGPFHLMRVRLFAELSKSFVSRGRFFHATGAQSALVYMLEQIRVPSDVDLDYALHCATAARLLHYIETPIVLVEVHRVKALAVLEPLFARMATADAAYARALAQI